MLWNWSIDIYYGGEVIKSNSKENDTLKVKILDEGNLVGETSLFPMRYLVDGSKKAATVLNISLKTVH